MITYSYRKIAAISWPLILELVIQTLIGTTDTIFLGHVGEVELGACAIGGLIYLTIFMIEEGFATGGQILMSVHNGEKKYKKIGKVFWLTNNMILVLSIAAIVLIFMLAKSILQLTIKDDIVQTAILIYAMPRCIGLIFSGIKSVICAFLVAINITRHIAISSVILLVSNIGLDWWLIFGGFGIEPMGMKGAAIASVGAEIIAASYLVGYILLKINLPKYNFNKFLLFDYALLKDIIKKSIYITLLTFFSFGSWLYFFVEIEKLGVEALAISNILKSLYACLCIVANGLSTATISIVGNLIGAKKYNEVVPTLKRVLKFGAVPYYGGFLLMIIFAKPILGIFTNNEMLINAAIKPLWVMLFANLITLPEYIYFYALYGVNKLKLAFVIETTSVIIYVLAIRIIIGICQVELAWCYMVDFWYHSLALPIAYWYMKTKKWQEK